MVRLSVYVFSFLCYSFCYAQSNYNLKFEISNSESVFLHSQSVSNNSVIEIIKDTTLLIPCLNNNLFYIKNSAGKYYLFLTENSKTDIRINEFNDVIVNGDNQAFIKFLNQYFNSYKPEINTQLDSLFMYKTLDEFEIHLYELINNKVFMFFTTNSLFEEFSEESKHYFQNLIKYEYLHTLSTFIFRKHIKDFSKFEPADGLSFLQNINIDFLEWQTFENSFNDTCHYELEVFQDYVFNTLLLFSIEKYNFQLKTIDDFQMFTIHFLNFMSNNVSSVFFSHCIAKYTTHFSPLFQRKTMNYIIDFLQQKNLNQEYIASINIIFESNYNPNQESIVLDYEVLKHEFYMEDMNGQQIFLSDFEGKVLYVDIWASWCGPCRKQFPYSHELKKKLSKKQLKKIKFIYISIDNDHAKWKASIKKLNIEGYNFISPAEKSNNAGQYFGASSIPRYILIDQDGNIVDNNAKRPSDPTLLDDLLKLIN